MSVLAGLLAKGKWVFFGGAGVSTASGIPDFRGTDGLYTNHSGGLSHEIILSHSYLLNHTDDFYRYYRAHLVHPSARPNAAHRALAKLEERGVITCVVTQNIDGLHQEAGSRRVLELHGSAMRYTCLLCHRSFGPAALAHDRNVPLCSCGGVIRPGVVLYDEPLDPLVFAEAERVIARADGVIAAGTSLTVYPAASLVARCPGELIIINLTPTPQDKRASLVIRGRVERVLAEAGLV